MVIILKTNCSRSTINNEKFWIYFRKTAEPFVYLHMPASVNKVHLQTAYICHHSCIFPTGIISVEADEESNKDFRRVWECGTRKIGRMKTNEDLLNLLNQHKNSHVQFKELNLQSV